MSTKELGITVKKDENLSEWYTQVVTKAQLADYSSAKGFMVLMPHGFAIWELIKEYFDKRIKEIGHKNAYFPLLIPERLLKMEAEHFEGFTPEVFWVTHSGDNELGERLAVRPTSETIIYESYSKWVKSWRDLPVLINVWNSVVRAEITSTRPFLR
ncbi:MAG TPA: proline--tRNA ligase, partial [Candidatus Bathyarchaeia archaeon]